MKVSLLATSLLTGVSLAASLPNEASTTLEKRNIAVNLGLNNGNGAEGSFEWTSWQNGFDPCKSGIAHGLGVRQPNNPCGHKFSISGIAGSLTWEGCGGNTWLNQDGQKVADCRWAPKKINCIAGKGFTGQYQCVFP